MDEFAAARLVVALSNFRDNARLRRKFANELYAIFASSTAVKLPTQTENTSWPFFPIKFRSPKDLLTFQEDLFPIAQTRRYYYPSMSEGYTGKGEILRTLSLDFSVELAATSLCLPVIPSLERKIQERYFNKICSLIDSLPE
jgi:dTDP-4-amino-4,6-dideoxygalactose transaminase